MHITKSSMSLFPSRIFAVIGLGFILTASGLSAATIIWNGPATTNTANNWSTSANWTGTLASTADVKFFDVGAVPGVSNINNTVDITTTIGSLQYGNTNNNHTTLIPSTVTLSVTNTSGLFVGTPGTTSPSTQQVKATVTGQGALVVTNLAANLTVNQGATNGTQRSTLDLTGLNTFSASVKNIFVGSAGNNGVGPAANGAAATGTLFLGKTNVITAVYTPATANYPTNVMAFNAGISIGYNGAGSGGGINYLYLGQTNMFNVDSISIGQTKGNALMAFGSSFTNNNPSAVFRGINGGTTRVSYWAVGDNGTRGGGSTSRGTNDFTYGTLDAMVNLLTLGQDTWASSASAADTASAASLGIYGGFNFPSGVLDVNTLTLGNLQSTLVGNTVPCAGVMSVGSNATLRVNTVLQMTFTQTNGTGATSQFTYGNLNVTNGTVLANSITVGAYTISTNNSINLSSATLIVSNALATSAAPLTNYYTANSLLGLTLTSDSSTKAFLGILTTGGSTNVIRLNATPVFFGSYPAQIALIKYTTLAGAGYNFGLTNIPNWAPGAFLSNNVTTKSVDLVLPSDPRPSTTAPASYSGNPGDNVIFSVTAGGVTPLSYQWRKNGANISDGATGNGSTNFGTLTATLGITNAQPADSASAPGYVVVITNLYGSITSSPPAVLTISASAVAPTITGPANQTVIQGNAATFTASVSGSPVPAVQWQTGGTNIPGATTSTLVVSNVQYPANDQRVYSIIATNTAGSVTNSATLTVIVPPVITSQPVNAVVTNTQTASFTVAATGVPSPVYQWKKNGTAISSGLNNTATNATFTIASVSPSDIASYSVTITNLAGTTNSASVTLTVNSVMATTALAPANGATGICYDTPLAITFNAAPSLGAAGTIKIYNVTNSTTPVDTISIASGAVQSRNFPGDGQAFAYQTIQISGNTARIYPHFSVMSSNATYYVTIDNGAFTDASGAYFAGITATNVWSFSTKVGGPVDPTNPVVNLDGSGDFVTVQGAVNSVPSGNTTPRVINVRNGLYNEIVDITGKNNVTLRGQSRAGAVIYFPNNATYQTPVNGGTTHARMTFKVNANDIVLDTLTVSNSTPQGGSQAEALMIESSAKRCIVYNSELDSRQDTILGNQNSSQTYFYKSTIKGNFDYIWGGGNFYFDQCEIRTINGAGQFSAARTDTSATQSTNFPWANPGGTYTANGMSFVNCTFTAESGVGPVTLAGSNGTAGNNVSWFGCDFATNYVAPSASLFSGNYLFWQNSNTMTNSPVTFAVLTTISGNDARLLAATNIPTWFYGWSPALAPNILTNPVSQTVTAGQSASFGVLASGFPLIYQWQHAGTNLPAATASTLNIASATMDNAGSYAAVVTTPAGSVTSSTATLTVNPLGITVTPNGQSKVYGAADPSLTYSYAPALLMGDSFSGALSRTSGENVGSYAITQGTLSLNANYTITFITGSNLVITPLGVTVTADGQTKVYGAADPALTYTFAPALISGDSFSGALSRTAGQSVGSHAINQGSLSLSANYTLTYVGANLTITPAGLTVTASSASKNYGQTVVFAGTEFTTSGLQFSDSVTGVTLTSTGATSTAIVGSYPIVGSAATGSGLGNYTISYVNGTLTVNPATLGVTADNQSRLYGAANPVFTASYSGFVNGDTLAVVSGSPSLTTLADTNSPVGTYAITAAVGSLTATNYTFSPTNGTLTVAQAAITVTADNQSRTYGAVNPILTASYSGFVNGDTLAVVSGAPSLITSADTNSPVGSYTITNHLGSLSATNYAFTLVNGTLTVNQASLGITANNASKTYDGTGYTGGNGVVYSGFVNGETSAVLGGSLSYGGTSQNATNVGSYTIVPSGQTSANYAISYTNGALTINTLGVTVTADGKTKVYGAADPALTYQHTPALVGGDSFSGALSRTAGQSVGSHAINQGSLSLSANYTLTYVGANLTITPAGLTVTANNAGKNYGQTVTFAGTEFTTSGLQFSDSVTGVTLTSAGATSTAIVGSYPIIASAASGSGLGNYTISYVNGTLTVSPATLGVTADNQSRLYGAANPVFTASYAGFVNGDTIAVVSGSPALATLADTNSPVGTYAITAAVGSLTATNYTFSPTNGTLTVAQAAITVTADNQSRTYGAVNPTLTASYSGFVNGDTIAVVSGAPSLITSADTNSPVGSYTITNHLGSLSATNYAFTLVNGTLTVNQAALGITANNASKTYDGTRYTGGNGVTYNGFVNGETSAVLGGSLSYGGSSQNATNAGSYTIVPSGQTSANYAISYTNGALTINTLGVTVTADGKTKVYGAADPALTYQHTPALVGGDSFSGALSRTSGQSVGSHAINQGSLSLSANYTLTYVGTNLTITPAGLTVTASSASKNYGQTHTFAGTEFTTSGLQFSDSVTGVTLTSAGATSTAIVGSYPITASAAAGSGLGNYTISYVSGTLTVNPATLGVTADNQSRLYGAANPVFTASYAGFVNGDTLAVVSGSPALATLAATNSPVGSYAITAAVGSLTATNYTFSPTNGTLTVAQAAITVTADNQSRTYGAANPILTASYSGFVNGDTLAVISGAPSLITSANTNSPVGSYTITNHLGSLSATNYAFTLVNGTLTVSQASLGITANNASKTYDGTGYTGGNGVTYSGFVNGETSAVLGGSLSYGGSSQNATNAGSYTIMPSGQTSANYAISYTNGALTINTLGVTVTADGKTKVYGAADPALTYQHAPALVGGDSFSGSLSRTSGQSVGSHAINQGSLSLSANYTLTYVGANLTITPASLTITANNDTKSYDGVAFSGGNGVTYAGFVNGETNTVLGGTLSYSGTSQGATNVGSYTIVPSGLTSGNYAIGFANGALTINALGVTVTADGKTKVYGAADPALTYQHTPALVGGDSFSGALSRTAGQSVGSHAINQGSLSLSANYTLTYVGANLTITPAGLTVTASSASKNYGQTVVFAGTEFTTSGLQFSDSVTGVTLTSAGATNTAIVGSYPIVGSAATGSGLGNYTISYVNGTLTVNAATPVVINAPVQLLDGNFQLTFTGGDAGVSYQIQASMDLSSPTWSILATNVATITGLPSFTDLDATNHAVRFYRTVTP